MAEHTENSVLVTDRRGVIEWANAGLTRLTGFSVDEVRGLKPGAVLQLNTPE